jgi:hypothetical protein
MVADPWRATGGAPGVASQLRNPQGGVVDGEHRIEDNLGSLLHFALEQDYTRNRLDESRNSTAPTSAGRKIQGPLPSSLPFAVFCLASAQASFGCRYSASEWVFDVAGIRSLPRAFARSAHQTPDLHLQFRRTRLLLPNQVREICGLKLRRALGTPNRARKRSPRSSVHRRTRQLELPLPATWGGARVGAGRKPAPGRALHRGGTRQTSALARDAGVDYSHCASGECAGAAVENFG